MCWRAHFAHSLNLYLYFFHCLTTAICVIVLSIYTAFSDWWIVVVFLRAFWSVHIFHILNEKKKKRNDEYCTHLSLVGCVVFFYSLRNIIAIVSKQTSAREYCIVIIFLFSFDDFVRWFMRNSVQLWLSVATCFIVVCRLIFSYFRYLFRFLGCVTLHRFTCKTIDFACFDIIPPEISARKEPILWYKYINRNWLLWFILKTLEIILEPWRFLPLSFWFI